MHATEKITFANPEKTIKVETTFVCTFKVFRDELEQDQWIQLAASPVRFMLEKFTSGQALLVGSPWRRRWFKGQRETVKTDAQSDAFSFNARVSQIGFDLTLKESGFNCVYMNPVPPIDTLSVLWVIVWMGPSKAQVLVQSQKCDFQLGVVRTNRGYGIRVPVDKHDAAYVLLRPNEVVPPVVVGRLMFRIEPLEPGVTIENVRAWLTSLQWAGASVVRAVGPRTWLVAATKEPSSQFVTFNGQSVLIRKLQSRREKPQGAILAGSSPAMTQTLFRFTTLGPRRLLVDLSRSFRNSPSPLRPTSRTRSTCRPKKLRRSGSRWWCFSNLLFRRKRSNRKSGRRCIAFVREFSMSCKLSLPRWSSLFRRSLVLRRPG